MFISFYAIHNSILQVQISAAILFKAILVFSMMLEIIPALPNAWL